MKTFRVALVLLAVVVFAAPFTDLLRSPETVSAMNRYRNAKAADLEVDIAYKANLYALEIRQRELTLREREAAIRRDELWSPTLVEIKQTAAYVALGTTSFAVLIFVTGVAYRLFFDPRSYAFVRRSRPRRTTLHQPNRQALVGKGAEYPAPRHVSLSTDAARKTRNGNRRRESEDGEALIGVGVALSPPIQRAG